MGMGVNVAGRAAGVKVGVVLAGMAARGTTTISRVYHLDRGYERMEDRLRSLGASIQRVDEKELAPSDVATAV